MILSKQAFVTSDIPNNNSNNPLQSGIIGSSDESTASSRSRVPTFEELNHMKEFQTPGSGTLQAPRPAVPVPRPSPKSVPTAALREKETKGDVISDNDTNFGDFIGSDDITQGNLSSYDSTAQKTTRGGTNINSTSQEFTSTVQGFASLSSTSSIPPRQTNVSTAHDLDIFGMSTLPMNKSPTSTSSTTPQPKDLNAEILASLGVYKEASR